MAGTIELEDLLKNMTPEIREGEYVFCTVSGELFEYLHLNPLAHFVEPEGLTLILTADAAQRENLPFENTFSQITLTVHSSLDAVGLTAAVAGKLTSHGISANVVAAYYHDHIFVQSSQARAALSALEELSAAHN